jgi:hypothetical protein
VLDRPGSVNTEVWNQKATVQPAGHARLHAVASAIDELSTSNILKLFT